MRCRSNKNKAASISSIERLPRDLLIEEVLRRVAATSFADITSLKLSCKMLKEITEDRCIYQHASLDKIPLINWKPLTKQQKNFLNKWRESQNPEIMYRQALLEYFTKVYPDMKSIHENLDRAAKLGHVGASYVACIIMLFSGDEDLKREGIESIRNMKKSAFSKKALGLCRNKLMNELGMMWINNLVFKDRPKCCTQHQSHYTNPWTCEPLDYECDACNADVEIDCIYASIPHM